MAEMRSADGSGISRKSSHLKRSVRELVDNAALLTGQVKQLDCSKPKSPLSRRSEAETR